MMPASSRRNILFLAVILLVCASAAFSEPPRSRQRALAQLASSETTARLEAIVWLADRGSMADAARLDVLLARGVQEIDAQDYKAAIATFSEIVRRKPGFAEGWNKRATVYYLAGEDRKSIADCGEVLKRNPRHFGALSGLGL